MRSPSGRAARTRLRVGATRSAPPHATERAAQWASRTRRRSRPPPRRGPMVPGGLVTSARARRPLRPPGAPTKRRCPGNGARRGRQPLVARARPASPQRGSGRGAKRSRTGEKPAAACCGDREGPGPALRPRGSGRAAARPGQGDSGVLTPCWSPSASLRACRPVSAATLLHERRLASATAV